MPASEGFESKLERMGAVVWRNSEELYRALIGSGKLGISVAFYRASDGSCPPDKDYLIEELRLKAYKFAREYDSLRIGDSSTCERNLLNDIKGNAMLILEMMGVPETDREKEWGKYLESVVLPERGPGESGKLTKRLFRRPEK